MVKKLSILICTLDDRKPLLDNLLSRLKPQISEDVEILIECDDGVMETGTKRNLLISRSIGDYTVFIDDDDLVSADYVKCILNKIQTSPDCIGFIQKIHNITTNEIKYNNLQISREINSSYINHICPIKRDISKKIKFRNISKGEDTEYQLRLHMSNLIKTFEFIPKILYEYNYIERPKEYNLKGRCFSGNIQFTSKHDIQQFVENIDIDYIEYMNNKINLRKKMLLLNNLGIKTNALINPNSIYI